LTALTTRRVDDDPLRIFFFGRRRGSLGGDIFRQWRATGEGGEFSGGGSGGVIVFLL
jgi:hypothetical protein